jgi:hypothetical protein
MQCSNPGRVKRFFLQPSRSIQGSTQLPIQWVLGAFPWSKADHSLPPSAKFKRSGTIPPCHIYAIVGCIGTSPVPL